MGRNIAIMHSAIGRFGFSVGRAGVVIGRSTGPADIQLDWDPAVSGVHARMWLEHDEIWIEDLESRNGVWIGRQKVRGRERVPVNVPLIIGGTYLFVDAAPAMTPTIDALDPNPLEKPKPSPVERPAPLAAPPTRPKFPAPPSSRWI